MDLSLLLLVGLLQTHYSQAVILL